MLDEVDQEKERGNHEQQEQHKQPEEKRIMADSLFYLISAETRSSHCKSQINLDLAYLAIHSSLLHPFLFLRRLGLILPLEPGHKAGLVNIPERSNAAARRNEDVSDVLDLLKAYSAFLARVLQLQA